MHFAPFNEIGDTPHILVDGKGNEHTVLALSHWPKSGTPAALKEDLSAEIVFKYLDHPEHHVRIEAVTNNHFDEDGLIGVYTLIDPEKAVQRREQLIDVASAGDFGTYKDREAARVAFTLARYADAERSPLDPKLFEQPYASMGDSLYLELLPRLPEMLAHPDRFRKHWEEDEALLDRSERALRSGKISIRENPALDLAVVTLPDEATPEGVERFTQNQAAVCHPLALHTATDRFRLLLVQGRTYEFQYRYETWVQYVSRRPSPRVDLAPLAADFSGQEEGGGTWKFDGVEEITPGMRLTGAPESRIAPERFIQQVESFLSSAPPAWDPYDAG